VRKLSPLQYSSLPMWQNSAVSIRLIPYAIYLYWFPFTEIQPTKSSPRSTLSDRECALWLMKTWSTRGTDNLIRQIRAKSFRALINTNVHSRKESVNFYSLCIILTFQGFSKNNWALAGFYLCCKFCWLTWIRTHDLGFRGLRGNL